MLDFSYNWHGANIVAAFQENITLSSISHQFGLNSKILKNRLIRLFSNGEKCIIASIKLHPSTILPSYYCDSTKAFQ
ncbi:helix-turn-helix domain-containing protein [Arsenophonus sp. aPb]|uniref:helix-turn-helix domain-containing protein n=1 Tax=Arsenophonus sp. aPb TaxID=3041619 RepID=UPI00246897A5|nr:helix-turn-helix domain-containing protein [Arsenophonus sp. aPb]WGL98334.1 helix-turn-helix domain-containing protein [Arsenophonus sp. aPb]